MNEQNLTQVCKGRNEAFEKVAYVEQTRKLRALRQSDFVRLGTTVHRFWIITHQSDQGQLPVTLAEEPEYVLAFTRSSDGLAYMSGRDDVVWTLTLLSKLNIDSILPNLKQSGIKGIILDVDVEERRIMRFDEIEKMI